MTQLFRRACALFCVLVCLCTFAVPAAGAISDPNINAAAVYLGDPETGLPLYEKNAEEKRYPASTTKIMTALIVLERTEDLNQKVTVTEEDFHDVSYDSSKAGFVVGEEVPVIDLLYGLLLPSGNEAANTLARFTAGSIDAFVDLMNAKAVELGCTGTHFENPNGLHDDNHYTTAHDLFRIATAAMQNETFADIADTAQKTLSTTNKVSEHPGGQPLKVYTTNMLIFRRSDPLYYGYCTGIKTGHTSQAGYCFVSGADKNGAQLISVMLGCEKPEGQSQPLTFSETRRLFDWAYENYDAVTLIEQGTELRSIPIRLSTDTDTLVLTAASDVTATIPKDLTLEDFELTYSLPDDLVAPVTAGQKIGSLTVSRGDITYETIDLLALSDVSLSEVLYYADKLENFFQSGLFKLILFVLFLLLAFYVSVYLIRERRRRERRRRMMRSKYARMEQYDRDEQHRRK